MLTLTTELAIDIDTLDYRNEPVARLSAILRDLQGEWASMTIPAQAGTTCLHWGTRVRFWIPDGTQIYEVIGTIVEQRPTENDASTLGDQGRIAGQKEVTARLAECRTLPQRRVAPRRMARFTVQYRTATPEEATCLCAADFHGEWYTATCVDIGAGGMRLRTEYRDEWPRYIALQFRLPMRATSVIDENVPAPEFYLFGRILRVATVRTRSGGAEIVVAFDRLSVPDGVRLNAFLCGKTCS